MHIKARTIHMDNEYKYANSIFKPCPFHVTTSQATQRKGLNSMVILGAWASWLHRKRGIFEKKITTSIRCIAFLLISVVNQQNNPNIPFPVRHNISHIRN
jgi:hypothetical protein